MNIFFVDNFIILGAFLVDFIFGDPKKYHPVAFIGKLIENTEKFFRKLGFCSKVGGIFLSLTVTVFVFFASLAFMYFLVQFSKISSVTKSISYGLLIIISSLFIALRGLVDTAQNINELLENNQIAEARLSLKALVGRDTERLSEEQIRIAIIESLSENLSDGVIAPIFYFFIGGFPLLVFYKTVNTLDSMVGYKNEKYIQFGWFSARMDDFLNYIPARITGFLIVISSAVLLDFSTAKKAFQIMLRDGRKHLSPNSGIPEAAIAGALGIRIGGPNYYEGVLIDKPYIGDDLNRVTSEHIKHSQRIVFLSSLLFVLLSVSIRSLV